MGFFPLAACSLPSLPDTRIGGHQLPTAVLHPRIGAINSRTALRFSAFWYDFGGRPRCTGILGLFLAHWGDATYDGATGRETKRKPGQSETIFKPCKEGDTSEGCR